MMFASAYDRDSRHDEGDDGVEAAADFCRRVDHLLYWRTPYRLDPIDCWLEDTDLLVEIRARKWKGVRFRPGDGLWVEPYKRQIALHYDVQVLCLFMEQEYPHEPVRWIRDLRELLPGTKYSWVPDNRPELRGKPTEYDLRLEVPLLETGVGWDGILDEFEMAKAAGRRRYDYVGEGGTYRMATVRNDQRPEFRGRPPGLPSSDSPSRTTSPGPLPPLASPPRKQPRAHPPR